MSKAGTGTGPNLLHTSLVVHGMLVQVVDTVLYRPKASNCRYQGPGSWILLCCVEGAIFADFSVFGKTHGYHFSNREMEILFFLSFRGIYAQDLDVIEHLGTLCFASSHCKGPP